MFNSRPNFGRYWNRSSLDLAFIQGAVWISFRKCLELFKMNVLKIIWIPRSLNHCSSIPHPATSCCLSLKHANLLGHHRKSFPYLHWHGSRRQVKCFDELKFPITSCKGKVVPMDQECHDNQLLHVAVISADAASSTCAEAHEGGIHLRMLPGTNSPAIVAPSRGTFRDRPFTTGATVKGFR